MPLINLQQIPIIQEIQELTITKELSEQILAMPKGEKRLELSQANANEIAVFKFTYVSNGHNVVGYLVEPKYLTEPLPCIIFNRGGSKEVSQWSDGHMFGNFVAKYAKWGYISITTQYSGNDGGEGVDEYGGDDLIDVLTLKNILNQYNYADTTKIGMTGGSRGGLMAYLTVANADWLQAVVIMAAPTNVETLYSSRDDGIKEFHRSMYNVDDPKELVRRSPIKWVDKFCKTTPILLIHGTSDWRVPVTDTLEMAEKLYEEKVPYKLIIYPGVDHFLGDVIGEIDIETKLWLDSYLKEDKPLPNLELHGV
jgi:dipeptidyl aminopeptidase/acylaminoacyl peptidase